MQTNKYKTILFDMMNTFMFNGDRFSGMPEMGRTYRSLGGSFLSDNQVHCIISETLKLAEYDYSNPTWFVNFKSIKEYILISLASNQLPSREADILDLVFVYHEIGTVEQQHINLLKKLSKRYTIGLVSNFWGNARILKEYLKRIGLLNIFQYLGISSEIKMMKPSPKIYETALDCLNTSPEKALFIGDNPRHDIYPLQSLGVDTAWVTNDMYKLNKGMVKPTFIANDIKDLFGDLA